MILHDLMNKMWKFKKFSATYILREINCRESSGFEIDKLPYFEGSRLQNDFT